MRAIFQTLRLQIKNSFARPTFKFIILFQPIFFSTITYMVYKDSGIESYLSYVVLGSGLLNLWSSIVYSSAGDIERERGMGNLEILSITNVEFIKILYGKILGNTLLGLSSLVSTFCWVAIVFGERLTISHPLLFVVGFLLMIISFMGLATVVGLLFTLSRSARVLMNCMEYPIYILTGMVFPLSLLPKFLLPLSWILAPTWVVKILHLSVNGFTNLSEVILPVVVLVSLSAVYYLWGVMLFRYVHDKTRRDGTLGVY